MMDARRALWLLAMPMFGALPACWSVSKPLPPKAASAAPMTLAAPVERGASPTHFAELPGLRPGERIARAPTTANAGPAVEVQALPPLTEYNGAGPNPTPPQPPPGGPLVPVNTYSASPLVNVPAVTIDPPLVAALRAYLENDPKRAVEALKTLDKANQEFVLAALPALARGAQMNLAKADTQDVAVLAEEIHTAAERLEPRAALRVDKLTFCRRVSGFGRYEPWPAGQAFQPNDLAELYLEIRHLCSEPVKGNGAGEGFVTRLTSSLEIRDATGQLVEQTDPSDWRRRVPIAQFDRTDHSRSPVRDYFLKYRFPVPATPGTYTVTVEVRDPAGSRTTRSQPLQFRVGP